MYWTKDVACHRELVHRGACHGREMHGLEDDATPLQCGRRLHTAPSPQRALLLLATLAVSTRTATQATAARPAAPAIRTAPGSPVDTDGDANIGCEAGCTSLTDDACTACPDAATRTASDGHVDHGDTDGDAGNNCEACYGSFADGTGAASSDAAVRGFRWPR